MLSLAMSLQIDYPEIAEGIMPRHRFMSAYEQRIEPPDRRWQYLLMAAEPYETIAFKVVCWDPGGSCRVCSIQAAGPSPHQAPPLGPCLLRVVRRRCRARAGAGCPP